MMIYFIFALLWAFHTRLAASKGPPSTGLLPLPRGILATSTLDTTPRLRRSLSEHGIRQRDTVTYSNTTTLDMTLENAVLFFISGSAEGEAGSGKVEATSSIEITCQTCYIKGDVHFRMKEDTSFNFTTYLDEAEQQIKALATNVTDYVEVYISNVGDNFTDGFDLSDFDPPTLPFDFSLNIPEIPEYRVSLQFDGLELYIKLSAKLTAGASYTFNLFTSETPIGVVIGGGDLLLGAVFQVDLILNVDSEIDITNGIHIKLDDGVVIEISLFSPDVSSVTHNGGRFEFLPVTVESPGVVLKATLRVVAEIGVDVGTYNILDLEKIRAGASASVFVNIAEFTTNVTLPEDDEVDTCAIRVVDSYQLRLGAEAGATLVLGEHTWGPVPQTDIPLWYTTLPGVCGHTSTTTITSEGALVTARAAAPDDDDEDLTTVTTTTKIIYTGTSCLSSGLTNCPVSLQTTTQATTTTTLTTTVSPGAETTFAASFTRDTVVSPIAFGANVVSMTATSGSPVSYVPPKPTSSIKGGSGGDSGGFDSGSTAEGSGRKNHTAVIVGVTVGVGVPLLLVVVGMIWYLSKRRRSGSAPSATSAYIAASTNDKDDGNNQGAESAAALKTAPASETTEIGTAPSYQPEQVVPLMKKTRTTDTVTALEGE